MEILSEQRLIYLFFFLSFVYLSILYRYCLVRLAPTQAAKEPLGAVNRVPSGGEFRSNLAVGGQPEATELSDAERAICAVLAPALQAEGLFFVGIDVIDGRLSEINVTSPTGIREVERLGGVPLADQLMERLLA